MIARINRRETITLFGGAAAAWPLAARAQQGNRVRRVGMLALATEEVGTLPRRLREELSKLAWIDGRNLRLVVRFAAFDADRYRTYAAELVSLKPDVIVTVGAAATKAVQQRTQTIPIVFYGVGDPLVGGIVKSVTRPEGNTTGYTDGFSSIGGKFVQLLKEAAPRIERVADIQSVPLIVEGWSNSIEEAARSLGLQAVRISSSNALEFERSIEAFAAVPNGGLIVQGGTEVRHGLPVFLGLVTKYRLPAIVQNRASVTGGGLMYYGGDPEEYPRRLASQVDRILHGSKPGDMPVEYPAKFKFVINLKAASAIGIEIPPTLRALADEVIE
jgi:putative ABC transport system substrate-binding protein